MKELSIEEKAKRYDEAIKLVNSKWHYKNQPCIIDVSGIFPELKESEDERIRKELTDFIKSKFENPCSPTPSKNTLANWIAWIEKQGTEPNWCHHKADLSNCSEEYRKAYYDGWNNCNMQYSQCKFESNDVVKCLINGMKFYYEDNTEATWGTKKFSMKVKDILAWLEKQGKKDSQVILPQFTFDDVLALQCCIETIKKVQEDNYLYKQLEGLHGKIYDAYYFEKHGNNADKGEPKFKIKKGKWYVCIRDLLDNYANRAFCKGDIYLSTQDISLIPANSNVPFEIACPDTYFRDWTIEDAKDGDVLDANGAPFIYKKHDEDCVYFYCGVNLAGEFIEANGIDTWNNNYKVYPATKEQHDLLFQKMKEAGWEWVPRKKELIKL